MRGPRAGTARRTAAGHPPTAHCRTRRLGRRTGRDLIIEAASNPTFPQFRPSPLGSLATAGEAPLYEFTRADLVVVDEEAEALLYDFTVLDGVMRTLAVTDRRRLRLLSVLARGLDAIAGGAAPAERAIDPRSGAGEPDRRTGAPGDRHGSRAHRHGVAVADPRDGAQVRAYVRLGGGVDGRRARLRVLLLAGPAVRVGPPA